ncbi:MAG: C_GCAxxG_C_C family protein [Clostridia bacterium]|nr:C_GCAxxG_C_C family protein [Clostridia bacterium]
MGTKAEKAKELFEQGYNCSQAVLGAFCEDLGMDFETAMKLSSSFGGGMGRMREVCGAVSGLFMAAGLKYGYNSPEDTEGKAKHYKLIQNLADAFKQKNGSIICRELLGQDAKGNSHIPEKRTDEYYKKRPCSELVKDAALIFEEILKNK